MKIDTIHNLVEDILENVPETRDSDELLYVKLITKMLEEKNIDVKTMTFISFLKNRTYYKLPSMESVGRVRRKCQEERTDLKSNPVVAYFKGEKEEEFREYARRKKYE